MKVVVDMNGGRNEDLYYNELNHIKGTLKQTFNCDDCLYLIYQSDLKWVGVSKSGKEHL